MKDKKQGYIITHDESWKYYLNIQIMKMYKLAGVEFDIQKKDQVINVLNNTENKKERAKIIKTLNGCLNIINQTKDKEYYVN